MGAGHAHQGNNAVGLKSLTFERLRTVILLCVGLFILVWNAIFGNQNMATYVVGLMLCGFPIVLNLDNLIRPSQSQSLTSSTPPTEPAKESTS